MGDLIVKAATGLGNTLKLQDQAGQLCFETLDSGCFYQNPAIISDNITIAAGYSAMFVGPVDLTGTVVVNGNLSIV